MYSKHNLSRTILTVAALFTLTACESDAVTGEGTITAPALESRTATGPNEANVSGEVRLVVGTSKVMSANVNTSRSRVLRWSSSNSDVASITSSGFLRGVSSGTAIVSVTGYDVNQSFRVIVESGGFDPEVVALVQVASPATDLNVGGTSQLAAIALNVVGTVVTGRPVTWRVASGTAVSVSANGLATALSPGKATVQATTDGVAGFQELTVLAVASPPVVSSVTVTSATGLLTVGNTLQMTANLKTVSGLVIDGRTVTWSVSSGTAVSISQSGVVTATSAGTATVKAAVDGVFGYASLTVIENVGPPAVVKSVTVSSPSLSMTVGSSLQMSALPADAGGAPIFGRSVTWRVYSSAVSISNTGVLTATGTGNMLVRARVDGVSGYSTITVNAAAAGPTVTSFSISPKTGTTLAPGNTRQFATAAVWSDNAVRPVTVTYTATGGTISSNGLFSAGQIAGTFLIVANCSCGSAVIADSAYVSVSVAAPQLASLVISPRNVTLAANASQQFTTTASWSTGASTLPPVTYSTNGGSVSSGGLFVAPAAAGTYRVIVAHTGGTKKDTATVVVQATTTSPPPPPPTTTAGTFFEETFETGARKNDNGFLWSPSSTTTVSSEMAYSGNYALRFEYGASASGDSWSEQRFDMGRYVSNVTVEYMLYVPANFKHRSAGMTNNKFLMMWRDTYGSNSGTWQIGWEYWRINDNTSSGRFMSSRWDFDWVSEGGPWAGAEPVEWQPLIGNDTPIRIGQWNSIKFRAKAASSRTAEDGESQLWINGALVFSYKTGRFHNFNASFQDAVLRNGYLMGFANSGFSEKTVFFVDNVKFSTGN